jgi:hypothetical protein
MVYSIGFRTADALMSSTASLEDVLWGLYHFLDNHPTETLLVSMKVDHGDDSLPVQEAAHALITGPDVKDYWVQSASVGITNRDYSWLLHLCLQFLHNSSLRTSELHARRSCYSVASFLTQRT